jgi:hypothetical protein
MESAITALKDTPIPTILVVAGIAFLLLAMAGQLAGRIVVAPERQRWAAVIGGGLLAISVALHIVPQARVTSPGTEGISKPPPSAPGPIVSPPASAGPVESYRIRTLYLIGTNVEFSVFVNDVQVGAYSSGNATADITGFIKPGANKVRIAWTTDPNMGSYAELIIEVKQDERWSPFITRNVMQTTKAGETTSTIIHHENAPQ